MLLDIGYPEPHKFTQSLAFSHKASDWPGWEGLYRGFFPTFCTMVDHRQHGEHQMAGIDRSVILTNSKQLLVDEKVRGRNKITGEVYKDILIEIWSNWERKSPGWAVKKIRADYIAYLIAPLGVAYLLPVIQLQLAVKLHCKRWHSETGWRDSHNPGYITRNIPVSVEELFKTMSETLTQSFEPFEVT